MSYTILGGRHLPRAYADFERPTALRSYYRLWYAVYDIVHSDKTNEKHLMVVLKECLKRGR